MKIFITLFVIFKIICVEGDEIVRVNRQAYIWNANACENGEKNILNLFK